MKRLDTDIQGGAVMFASPDKAARVWHRLASSQAARRFQVAFSVATGLPLTFMPVVVSAAAPTSDHRGGVCIEGCMGRQSGRFCLKTLQDAEQRANKGAEPIQFRCPAGLQKVIVPVVIGGKHAGNLLAGPFTLQQLDRCKLSHLTDDLKEIGLESQVKGLQRSWEQSPVLTTEKVEAVRTLVSVFAEHLAQTGNQLLASEGGDEHPLLEKVNSYLAEAEEEDVSLDEVARRVAVSRCHFCKLFKKQTGVTFSEYRVRRRIDKAQQLLLNPALRISEAAFQSGFESLPYFNRAFRRYVGCSPSEYRSRKGLQSNG